MFAPVAARLRQKGIPFQENAPIAPHLYFRIGGRVRMLVFPSSAEQTIPVLEELSSRRLPFVVIGGGSNIVFGDGLTQAAVVLVPAPLPPDVRFVDPAIVQVGAGVRNQSFLSWCAANGAGGLEFLSGIPGTLGGAAAVNAGAFGRSISDALAGADVVDESGVVCAVDAGRFAFRYRDSRFKLGRETILFLRLRIDSGDKKTVGKKIRDNLTYRAKRHPSYRLASAGCFFKNPLIDGVKTAAGKIIEECGLKKASCGDLIVAEEHANFLLNRGQGTFADLQKLEERIKKRVADRTGIILEREVIYVSSDGKKY